MVDIADDSLVERSVHFELGEVLERLGEFLFAGPASRGVQIKLYVIIACTFFHHFILI